MKKRRKLDGAQGVTLLQAFGVRRAAEAQRRKIDERVAELQESIEDLLAQSAKVDEEEAEHIARLVGYLNTGEGAAIPTTLSALKVEGPEGELVVEWEEAEPKKDEPQAQAPKKTAKKARRSRGKKTQAA